MGVGRSVVCFCCGCCSVFVFGTALGELFRNFRRKIDGKIRPFCCQKKDAVRTSILLVDTNTCDPLPFINGAYHEPFRYLASMLLSRVFGLCGLSLYYSHCCSDANQFSDWWGYDQTQTTGWRNVGSGRNLR
jgi:hypothetical protein